MLAPSLFQENICAAGSSNLGFTANSPVAFGIPEFQRPSNESSEAGILQTAQPAFGLRRLRQDFRGNHSVNFWDCAANDEVIPDKRDNSSVPSTSAETSAHRQRVSSSRIPTKGNKINNILVIEDDYDTRFIINESLAAEGYCVRNAIDRDEALEHLNRALFQVIVMDLCMPGGSAEEFLAFIRKKYPHSRVILITAVERAAAACVALNLDAFLGKPFEMSALIDLIKRFEES